MDYPKTGRWIVVFAVCVAFDARAARFLFDGGHAETAGNADWVIDADVHNISWTSSGTFTPSGSDSSDQRIPTPAQSGITGSTTETFWEGALSAWAVDLVKRGHSVETLPAGHPRHRQRPQRRHQSHRHLQPQQRLYRPLECRRPHQRHSGSHARQRVDSRPRPQRRC